jgi:hypothetical protein
LELHLPDSHWPSARGLFEIEVPDVPVLAAPWPCPSSRTELAVASVELAQARPRALPVLALS